MRWGFFKPNYVHYAKKWEIYWFGLSYKKKIMISPAQVEHTILIAFLGFGTVIKFIKSYVPAKPGRAKVVDTRVEDFIDGKNGR